MGSYESNTLPYWQVNIPEQDRTAECPDFLKNLTDKDRGIIGTPDAEYRLQTWEDVCRFVSTNRLELFQRRPSDLRRYKAFTYNLAKRYGSVANFILSQRLGWEAPLQPKGKPFQEPSDIKILMNDWPYGIEPRVTHLVVWVKFALEEDPATGDLTDQARAEIESFVTKTFCQHVPRSQVSNISLNPRTSAL
jgi:hypothetical protein